MELASGMKTVFAAGKRLPLLTDEIPKVIIESKLAQCKRIADPAANWLVWCGIDGDDVVVNVNALFASASVSAKTSLSFKYALVALRA